MRKLLLAVCMMGTTAAAWAAPPAPVDNTVSPCDSSQHTGKPPCNADSESITVPAPTHDEKEGVIVPPAPTEGLPEQDKKVLPDKAPGKNKAPRLEKR